MTTETRTTCTDTEDCMCADCVAARKDFDAWCDAFEKRWEAQKHRDCGPLCTEHGDVRDHSAVR